MALLVKERGIGFFIDKETEGTSSCICNNRRCVISRVWSGNDLFSRESLGQFCSGKFLGGWIHWEVCKGQGLHCCMRDAHRNGQLGIFPGIE